MENKNWIQTIQNKVVGFYYTLDTTFAILRVAIFALLGYTMHQLVFSKMSAVPKKSHADVSSSAISEDLMQLMGWSALATSLSYGIFRLIIEAMEGGMSFALERVFGAFFFIAFFMTMVLMVIPEIVRLLKKMGYLQSQSGLSGLNRIVLQSIMIVMSYVVAGIILISWTALAFMDLWSKSRVAATIFVVVALTSLLLVFRPTIIETGKEKVDYIKYRLGF